MLVHTALDKLYAKPSIRILLTWTTSPTVEPAPPSRRPSHYSCNVVYAIQCKQCRIIYVGETGATIKQRLYQHVYHIQKGTNQKRLYIHFIHHHITNFSLSGLEINAGWSLAQRRAAERRWIFRLSSTAPLGLNENPSRPSTIHQSTPFPSVSRSCQHPALTITFPIPSPKHNPHLFLS